jgi:hypothetical protein
MRASKPICYSEDLAKGFCCEPLPAGDGWTWTLISRMSDLLAEAEDRYGNRDLDWTPIGIEFGGDWPSIWYPGYPGRRHISIKLSRAARQDFGQAIFELSHEVIHLLGPAGRRAAPAIEEGVAVLFSEEVSRRFDVNLIYVTPAYIRCRDVTVSG